MPNLRDLKVGTLIRDINNQRWFKPQHEENMPPILINLKTHKIRYTMPNIHRPKEVI